MRFRNSFGAAALAAVLIMSVVVEIVAERKPTGCLRDHQEFPYRGSWGRRYFFIGSPCRCQFRCRMCWRRSRRVPSEGWLELKVA